MLQNQIIQYTHDNTTFDCYISHANENNKRPAVLIFPDWTGRNPFSCKKADLLAEWGYVGIAVDLYGNGKLGQTKEEKSALIQPLMQDRALLRDRLLTAYQVLTHQPMVDVNHIASIGFCFGGLCALDLARAGAALKGTISFHGLLQAPESLESKFIHGKILALHGYDDPMVPPEAIDKFAAEMKRANASWEMHLYGNTLHAFTNPEANDPDFGTVYSKDADNRSQLAMKQFLEGVF